MAIIKPTKPYAFTNGTGNTADADEVNEDFDVLYAKIDELIDILNNSAGTKTALANRLAVAINDDGTLRSPVSTGGEWVMPGLTAAYVSATQFTVSGDQTDIYLPGSAAGRRLKVTLAASTVYTKVSAATYSAGTGLTTVTVANNVLTNPITSVEHGIVSPVSSAKSSLPVDASATADTIPVRDGSGRIKVANGAASDDAVSKEQLDLKSNLVADGQTFTGRQVFSRTGQTAYGVAAVESFSPDGDVWISAHSGGASAAALRHIRGGNGFEVRDNAGNLARIKAATAVASDDVLTKGQILTGRVNAAGTAVKMPSGWVIAKLATGRYEITHGLGHENYTPAAFITQRTTSSTAVTAFVSAYAGTPTTKFDVYTINKDGIVTDGDFSFTVILD